MRQLPRVSLEDRICTCEHPRMERVRWRSLYLMICLRCECFFTDDLKLWPNANHGR
jgi:hypothetical protein